MRFVRANALIAFLLVAHLLSTAEGGGNEQERNTADPRAISDAGTGKDTARPNLLIIGASSLTSPVGQTQLLGAMLESKGMPMHIEGRYPKLDAVNQMLGSTKVWDYIVMDAWHFGKGKTEPPAFPNAVAGFVKQVHAHSPKCNIILFSWWVPDGPKATNEGGMEVFHECVKQAKVNDIWVATTGPAFMEARLDRPDLRITVSKTDAHPGVHGAYLNACSLFSVIANQSPVGLPATLKITGAGAKQENFTVAAEDAKYLQERAWKVHQREVKNIKPAKQYWRPGPHMPHVLQLLRPPILRNSQNYRRIKPCC